MGKLVKVLKGLDYKNNVIGESNSDFGVTIHRLFEDDYEYYLVQYHSLNYDITLTTFECDSDGLIENFVRGEIEKCFLEETL